MVRTVMKHVQPMGRTGEAEEMAKLAAFIVSDDNAFMTGSDVVADGGLKLRMTLPPQFLQQ